MKTYEEAVQFVSKESFDSLRYYTWPAVAVMAEIYGVEKDAIGNDLAAAIKKITEQQQAERKKKNREEHLKRQAANLAAKVASQG